MSSVKSQLKSKEESFEKRLHVVIICVPSFTFELTLIFKNVSKIMHIKMWKQSQFDYPYAYIIIAFIKISLKHNSMQKEHEK